MSNIDIKALTWLLNPTGALLAFSVTYFVYERYILKASGSGLTSLIIADNNLGLVSIYGDRYKILSHKLLVRTIKETKTKIHETITELGFW